MNVLFVHEQATAGGTQTRVLTHGQSLLARGHRVFVACSDGIMAAAYRQAGIEFLDLGPTWMRPGPLELLRLRQFIREKQIAFCDVQALLSLLPGGVAALCERVPLALNLHGRHVDADRVLLGAGLRILAPWASWVAVNAPSTMTYVTQTLPVAPERLRCHPNCVDDLLLSSFPPASLPPVKLLALSRLDNDKVESLRAAGRFVAAYARRVPGLQVRVVGDGVARSLIQKEWAEQLPGVAVDWVGSTAQPQEMIGWSDAVLGLGRVALEAMAAGRPVVLCGVLGNLAGLCRLETIDTWFESNLNGRNAPAVTPEAAASDLLSVASDVLGALAQWVGRQAGLSSLDSWAASVEDAAASGPLPDAARQVGETALALWGEYVRVCERAETWEAQTLGLQAQVAQLQKTQNPLIGY